MPSRPPPPLILPKSLDPIAFIIGLDKAMVLARSVKPSPSGPRALSLYIPHSVSDANHFLVRTLGGEVATRLCQEMGGVHWFPPGGEYIEAAVMARQVLDLHEIGCDQKGISERAGITQRAVSYILSAWRVWETTGDLEEACRHGKMSKSFLSLMLNRGW